MKLNKADKAIYIDTFLEVARPEILKRFSKLSCIATYTITKRILDPLGVKVEPVPCRVLAYNPLWTAKYREHGFPTAEQMDEWTKEGAWSVGMGDFGQESTDSNDWIGHMAILIAGHYFVDLCIDALHRPDQGILLEGQKLMIDIPYKSVWGQPFQIDMGEGMLIYEADPKNVGYKNSPEWTITPAIDETCNNIRREMLRLFAERRNGRAEEPAA